ncbi:class I SAM-dependent methyltransferase [Psychrobacter sp. 2Y5]|uniref:class I SAM-dependent methyltransferase n=1 Tax=unclassified Psychrobacter TaxID=196806 RepID=UPI003F466700
MANWSEGYISDINYTYGYYSELNPNSVKIPFLMAGLDAPKFTTACELGFGQGMSINAHAAASDVEWYGTDFNPSQASFAKELSNISTSNAHLFDQSFSEFCNREDLPDFDFIGLHGIWSWVSNENREVIADFIRRKLKVGGVLYISYNTLPGWSAASPIRHMLTEHDHMHGSRGQGMGKRVEASIKFTQELLTLCQPLVQQVPSIPKRLDDISQQNPNYLAHEYFNRDWQPMYFSEMADWLSPTKTSFACSANFLEDYKPSSYNSEQLNFIESLDDPMFAQSVKDYMHNKQFRRDYWVKGARKVSTAKLEQTWHQLRFMMISSAEDIKYEVNGAAGNISLREDIYKQIITLLSDYQIHQVASLQQQLPDDFQQSWLFESLAILYSQGAIVLLQDDDTIDKVRERCNKLNAYVMQQSLVSPELNALVSPLTGSALTYSRFPLIFLHAYTRGKNTREQWVDYAWQALKKNGQLLLKDGNTLREEKDNIAELNRMVEDFEKNTLPLAKRLQIVT